VALGRAGQQRDTILGRKLMDPRADPEALLPLLQRRYESAVARLEQLVNQDSGSFSPEGVNRVAGLLERDLRSGGWMVERRAHQPGPGEPALGDTLIGRRVGGLARGAGGRRLLLLAHMDTVFDDGEAAARPFRTDGRRAFGPGVTDDKAGLVTGVEAVETLCDDAGFEDFQAITLVFSPDEEIGSPFSKGIIQELAADHDVAIGLEAARTNGDLVSARKGIAALEVLVTGRAVHAGVRPEKGASAALEAAHHTIALHRLNHRWPGVTCNVGTVRAGTRPNVVAAAATLELDLRATTAADFERALEAVSEIVARQTVAGTRSTVRLLHRHPPMERTAEVLALVAEAQRVARGLGFEVGHTATGGAGDANTTAAAGVATIDGLAPVGGDAHGPSEWLDLDSVVPRTALLAGLLARLGSARPGREA
jgi:glutamate carboxypeptidase